MTKSKAPEHIKIVSCTDGMMWYSSMIGQTLKCEGICSDGYWAREPAGYRNIVRIKDAVPISDNKAENKEKSGTIFKEYPSGRVLCCLPHDQGSINCLSDSTQGDYDKRAQEALQKAREIQSAMQYLNTLDAGQAVHVVV